MKYLVHFRVLERYRWQDDEVLSEGGDEEMAVDNARRMIVERWGKHPAYVVKKIEKVE